MPSSNYSVYDEYVPLAVTAVGNSVTPDLTLDSRLSVSDNYSSILRRRAYERLDSASLTRANPPFDTGAAGRIIDSLTERRVGADPRIVRGYVRRSVLDRSDPTSSYRLYFMYNPDTIQRNYVSYLDQQALDPFNTIFNSQNLVAPPGILDFSFDLFFDRQVENANGSMPRGVLEDFDYFDLVIRGVVPDAQMPDLPDNGVLMVNPRNITVVFSPQLSVQGRPYNASVVYEKFDHRMRPIRMRISLSIKAYYIGPVRPDFTFSSTKVESVVAATVPYDESITYTAFAEEVKFKDFSVQDPDNAPNVTGKFSNQFTSDIRLGATKNYSITQPYGNNGHPGVDINTPNGVPVIAPASGTVYAAGANNGLLDGYGNCVVLQIGDAYLFYGHLRDVNVEQGQEVVTGYVLGHTDNTGMSTGPHLHFEIRTPTIANGNTTDPEPYLRNGWEIIGE